MVNYYDICYGVLTHYLGFSDVADTYKDINDGLNYLNNFPKSSIAFALKQGEIITYIMKVRTGNIIDAYHEKNPLALVFEPSGRLLSELTPDELYNNLNAEIPRLILKGIHQTVKHLEHIEDDNALTAELLQEDTSVLRKHHLQIPDDAGDGGAS